MDQVVDRIRDEVLRTDFGFGFSNVDFLEASRYLDRGRVQKKFSEEGPPHKEG